MMENLRTLFELVSTHPLTTIVIMWFFVVVLGILCRTAIIIVRGDIYACERKNGESNTCGGCCDDDSEDD